MPTEPPKIEWRMREKRHHMGYVEGKARFRIEPNRVFPKLLELHDKGRNGCVIKDTAEGKRIAEQIVKGEITLAAEKLLPTEVQLKIASAIAEAAEEAAMATRKALLDHGAPPDDEAVELFTANATYHAIGALIAAGLLSKEGVKV